MNRKPQLSFWQIWNMSFGFLGIQFGFALQNANTSRIFETLGANVDDIPILWIAAPVTGLIIQPIIGYLSDKTWGKLGRRRPYFLVGAILASLALFIMPNSPVLWVAAGMLWIMDASINVSMEPFRAFVGDMLPSEQRTKGFAMQSFFIGTGAVVASALPYLMTNLFGVDNTAPAGEIPLSVKLSFYIGGGIFFIAVLWTVIRSKEYSPDQLKKFEEIEKKDDEARNKIEIKRKEPKYFVTGLIWILSGAILSFLVYYFTADKKLYIITAGSAFFGLIQVMSGLFIKSGKDNGLVSIINDLFNMPKTMKQLAIVQFFSWFALFAMWIYTTNGLTSHTYDMKLNSQQISQLQTTAQKWVGKIDDEKYDELQARLIDYQKQIDAGSNEVVTNIEFVKFFLTDKLINQSGLYNALSQSLEETDFSSFDKGLKAQGELAITNLKDYTEKGAQKITANIDYSTINFVLENDEVPKDHFDPEFRENLVLYSRLKYIQKQYNTGADWVGICFAAYNGFAAIFAFLLMFIAKRTSRKFTHALSLVVGGISLATISLITNPDYLLVNMAGIGLAWASILSMPYAILTGSLPSNKLGVYMGIFNFFIVIPQIVSATILGLLVMGLFEGQAIYTLVMGGFAMIVAAILVMFVKDDN